MLNVVAEDVPTPRLELAHFKRCAANGSLLIVLQTSCWSANRRKIAALAATTRLPAIYGYRRTCR